VKNLSNDTVVLQAHYDEKTLQNTSWSGKFGIGLGLQNRFDVEGAQGRNQLGPSSDVQTHRLRSGDTTTFACVHGDHMYIKFIIDEVDHKLKIYRFGTVVDWRQKDLDDARKRILGPVPFDQRELTAAPGQRAVYESAVPITSATFEPCPSIRTAPVCMCMCQ